MSTPSPPLSVVMPVRNALPFLDQAIESILAQSFRDFEFLILDDASDDGSAERLASWARRDLRIRLHRSDRPLGPVGSSQRVVELSAGPIVARMDADDLSHPERLERQMALFRKRPDAVLAGTLQTVIDSEGRQMRGLERSVLARPSALPPFHHGSIMFRRAAFDAVGGYRTGHEYWEDVDLFLRLSLTGPVFVIPDALYTARYSDVSTRVRAAPEAVEAAYDRMVARVRGTEVDPRRRPPPSVFVHSASPHLWAGRRPRTLSRFLRRGQLRLDRESLKVLAFLAWAETSPRSLRFVLKAAGAFRERRSRAAADRPWIEWRSAGASNP